MQEYRLAYLLHSLPVLKDVFQSNIEFAEVVLPHTIFVPADSFEKEALYANHREIERDIPFRIESFADDGGRFLCVP